MAWTIPWQLLGVKLAGDVGGYSTYTDRFGKKIVYPFSPPKEPPSEKQVLQRAAFKSAQAAWRALTLSQKEALENACRATAIPMTGQNLYMSAIMCHHREAYLTVQRQSGITLPPLPPDA